MSISNEAIESVLREALAGNDEAAARAFGMCGDKLVAANALAALARLRMDFPATIIAQWTAAIDELHPPPADR